jgi:hypothetical protein
MSSYSITRSRTFTRVHARYIAAKVAADLMRMRRFYGDPSEWMISALQNELVELLVAGYLDVATCGFIRDGKWITPTVMYTASELGDDGPDDDPGRIPPGADASGAGFWSYVTYSQAWFMLTQEQRKKFYEHLQISRVGAATPGVNGYFAQDRTYSSGGRALIRSSVRGL